MEVSGFDRVAPIAEAIRGALNRLVFTGIETCEWSFDDYSMGVRGSSVRSKTVSALATVAVDRLGPELSAAGLSRVRRTPDSDIWQGPAGTDLELIQAATEVTNPVDAFVREYAVLFTRTVKLSETITVRASAPSAQLALWWRSYARSRTAGADAEAVLEDIIELVVRRPTLVQEVRALPVELRDTITRATSAFLASVSHERAIGRALTDSRLSPGIVTRVVARFEQICEAA